MQALLVEAEEFDDEARGGIEREIPAQDRAGGVRPSDLPVEEQKDQRVRGRFVELSGM
jgi:hypothetical protein